MSDEPSAAQSFYVRSRGELLGPLGANDLAAMIADGRLTPMHEISRDGIQWSRAHSVWNEIERRIRDAARSANSTSAVGLSTTLFPTSATGHGGEGSHRRRRSAHGSVQERDPSFLIWSMLVVALHLATAGYVGYTLRYLLPLVNASLDSIEAIRIQFGNPAMADIQQVTINIGIGVLGCIVMFVIWTYTASRILHSRGIRLRNSPGAAAGWFFVPIANLWKPYQVIREISDASLNALPPSYTSRVDVLVPWWWMLCVTQYFVSRVGNYYDRRITDTLDAAGRSSRGVTSAFAEVPELLKTLALWETLEVVLFVVAATLAASIVGSVGLMQDTAFFRPSVAEQGLEKK